MSDILRETAKSCLNQGERAITPPEIRKFRRSTYLEPGQRFQHYGLADDYAKLNLSEKIYGVTETTKDKIGAAELINLPKTNELQKINLIKAEKQYRQLGGPLGVVPDKGVILPSKFTTGREPFGQKSASSLEPAKALIFPTDIHDTDEGNALYRKSHGSFLPGEQKKYGYQWNIDPETTRFGAKGDTIAFNGVSQNIADVMNASTNASRLVGMVNTKTVEDFKNMGDILAQSKNLGQNSSSRPKDFVYGKPSSRSVTIGAYEVIRGKYKDIDTLPDEDLGKSITPGFRNLALTDRAYGCPSIRSDIPRKPINTRSMADSQNYGDDVPAQDLINPPAFSDLSIDPLIMNQLYHKERLLSLFARIGYSFDDDLGTYLFEQAADGEETTTINSFRDALNHFIISKDLKK